MPSPIVEIEGGDGNGKSTALQAVRAFLEEHLEVSSFDVIAFEQREGRWPTTTEIDPLDTMAAQVLLVGEPTYVGVGKTIREALKHSPKEFHDPWVQAQSYARDREELVTRVILPYLSRGGKQIVRSRGLLSSLAYQAPRIAVQDQTSLAEAVRRVMTLPGNRLSIQYAPRLCLLLDLPPDEASRRMSASRGGVLDHFERDRALQQNLRQLYHHPAIQEPFREQGTTFVTIDTSGTKLETTARIRTALRSFYP